jgi:hypothetical protein
MVPPAGMGQMKVMGLLGYSPLQAKEHMSRQAAQAERNDILLMAWLLISGFRNGASAPWVRPWVCVFRSRRRIPTRELALNVFAFIFSTDGGREVIFASIQVRADER